MQRIITTDPFSPDLLLKLIEKYKVTTTFSPPAYLAKILKHPPLRDANLSSIKQYWTGSAPVHEYLIDEMNKYLPNGNVFIKYGLSEVFGGISYNDPKLRKNSLGKLVAGLLVKIIDKNGKRCGVGVAGEICFKSKHILMKYHCNEEATRKLIDNDGFVKSGDFGYFDEDGFLFMIDRNIDLIQNGDKFVSSTVIENVILQMNGVQLVAVVGVKSLSGETLPAAAVIKNSSALISEQNIYDVVKGI